MNLSNLVLFLLLVIFGLFFYNNFLKILNKYNPKLLIDAQFSKPQAFHEYPISVAGGTGIFLLFLIVYFNFLFFKNIIFFEYLSICTFIFFLGFFDDVKINTKPKYRLALMIIFLLA